MRSWNPPVPSSLACRGLENFVKGIQVHSMRYMVFLVSSSCHDDDDDGDFRIQMFILGTFPLGIFWSGRLALRGHYSPSKA